MSDWLVFIKTTYNFAIVNPNINVKILEVKRTFLWRFKGMGKSCALLAHHGSTTNVLCAAKGSDLYGTSESTTVYSGYIGVGEMWGYFMEEAMLAQWKGVEFLKSNCEDRYWFKPRVYGQLYENGDLQIRDIYKCMTSSVTTQYKLKKELVSKKSEKKNEIENAFKFN